MPLLSLLDGWKAETKPAPKTAYSWGRTIGKLVDFLGHDDASRISANDLIRWKDTMVAAELSPRTVRDTRLAPVRTILQWAIRNRRLDGPNPAAAVQCGVLEGAR